MINLTNEDNMILMKRYSDKYFDLAIVDPPYGIIINMNLGIKKGKKKLHNKKDWDKEIPNNDYFEELFRVSKNQIIWGGNYFPLPLTKSWIFWDKNLPEGLSFSDGELAWTSFDTTLKKARIKHTGAHQTDKDKKIHPTQKPVALYKWILDKYAKRGDKILDTHLGSGSIALACYDYDFDLTACELDKEYFDKANNRIELHKSQLKIF